MFHVFHENNFHRPHLRHCSVCRYVYYTYRHSYRLIVKTLYVFIGRNSIIRTHFHGGLRDDFDGNYERKTKFKNQKSFNILQVFPSIKLLVRLCHVKGIVLYLTVK